MHNVAFKFLTSEVSTLTIIFQRQIMWWEQFLALVGSWLSVVVIGSGSRLSATSCHVVVDWLRRMWLTISFVGAQKPNSKSLNGGIKLTPA
jgi:hypothetical protein